MSEEQTIYLRNLPITGVDYDREECFCSGTRTRTVP